MKIKFNTQWNKTIKSFEIRYANDLVYSTPIFYIGIYKPGQGLVKTYSIEFRIKILWLTILLRNRI